MMYFELVSENEAVLMVDGVCLAKVSEPVARASADRLRMPFVIFTGVEEVEKSVKRQVESGKADKIWLL